MILINCHEETVQPDTPSVITFITQNENEQSQYMLRTFAQRHQDTRFAQRHQDTRPNLRPQFETDQLRSLLQTQETDQQEINAKH